MSIQDQINNLWQASETIMQAHPSVTNIRHVITDIPYSELLAFGRSQKITIHTDSVQNRAYIIHSPLVDGKMHSDFWIYSTVVKIKPAEIIED